MILNFLYARKIGKMETGIWVFIFLNRHKFGAIEKKKLVFS